MSVLVADSPWRECERTNKLLKPVWSKTMKKLYCDCPTCREKRSDRTIIFAVLAFFAAVFLYAAFWK